MRTVIDLRTRRETNAGPNRFGRRRGVHYEPVDLVGDSHEIISRGDTIVARGQVDRLPDGRFADPVGRITTIYTTMLDHQRDAFRRVIAVLAARSVHSAVFHCVAGQDRTGLIAALLQSTADVDEETIVFDYAAHGTLQRHAVSGRRRTGDVGPSRGKRRRLRFTVLSARCNGGDTGTPQERVRAAR